MGRNRIYKEHQATLLAAADVAAPAAHNAATITYAAFPGAVGTAAVGNQPKPAGYPIPAAVSHVITGFRASVAATAALTVGAATVIVKDGTTVVFDQHLLADAAGAAATGAVTYSLEVKFPFPKKGSAGKALVVQIPDPGAGNTAKLVVFDHWTEIN